MNLYAAVTVIRGLKRGDLLTFLAGKSATLLAVDPLREAQAHDNALLVSIDGAEPSRLPVLSLKESLMADDVCHYPQLAAKVALQGSKTRKVYQSRTRQELSKLIAGLVEGKPSL